MYYKKNFQLSIQKFGPIPKKLINTIYLEQYKIAINIAKILNVQIPKKINIFLYYTKKDKKIQSGIGGNCHADLKNNTIHAWMKKGRTSLGYHEMTHIIANQIGQPPRVFLEGLAMWFDKTWHSIPLNKLFINNYKKKYNNYLIDIISDDNFNKLPFQLSYSFSGIIVKVLIYKYGLKKFLFFYKKCNRKLSKKQKMSIFKKIYKNDFSQTALSNITNLNNNI